MAKQFTEAVTSDPVVSAFALMLLHAVTNAHINHWRAKTYAHHIALGEFYSGLEDKLDSFIEAYMGKYGVLENYKSFYALPGPDPVAELELLCNNVYTMREKLPQDSELQNLIDEIKDLIDSTLYKLRFLK
jgi:hypothetical protein